MGSREAMEEEIEPYSIKQAVWSPNRLGILDEGQMDFIAKALVAADAPLVITGYTGRTSEGVDALVELANTIRGMVLDCAGAQMCFPADHPAYQGLRYGEHESITKADVILVLECDVCYVLKLASGCLLR